MIEFSKISEIVNAKQLLLKKITSVNGPVRDGRKTISYLVGDPKCNPIYRFRSRQQVGIILLIMAEKDKK